MARQSSKKILARDDRLVTVLEHVPEFIPDLRAAGDTEEWRIASWHATSEWRHMKAKIIVMPKRTVLDPQGKTVKHALESMDFKGIKDVRIGKFMEIELEGGDKAELQKKIDEACHKLLSNPVIEEYTFEIHE
jgi:phosphoribosylformylglycinamidine synthase subunit PurS